jgi:hypothetical protein
MLHAALVYLFKGDAILTLTMLVMYSILIAITGGH